jgi:CDP-paratose 2-epimerase
VYGDGLQARDLLWVDDLCDLYRLAIEHIDKVRGKAYNIGGGPANVLSVREVLHRLEALYGRPLRAAEAPWRPGDQRIFVADTARITSDLGWQPTTSVDTGISLLVRWVQQSTDDIERVVAEAGQLAPV